MSNNNKLPIKKNRIIGHVDMDAFFAAVEQHENIEYRGKPVIIGAHPKEGYGRGVVSTASYEARKFGIHSAMPISIAYKKCPNAIFVKPNMKLYSEYSKKIMNIFLSFTPLVEQVSVDEAFLDLSGCERLFGSPRKIGEMIKRKIKNEIGITASVGIATNKSIAKIASDIQKPNGLTIIYPGNELEFLAPLNIKKIWGIGAKTAEKLNQHGFNNIADLLKTGKDKLISIFGKRGYHFWEMANGIDERPVINNLFSNSHRSSISREITYHQDVGNEEQLKQSLFKIADDVCRQVRTESSMGKTVQFKIRFEDFKTYTRSKTISQYFNDTETFYKTLLSLFQKIDKKGKKVRLIGGGISNFKLKKDIDNNLINIMEESTTKEQNIDTVLDNMKEKFGSKTIERAKIFGKGFEF